MEWSGPLKSQVLTPKHKWNELSVLLDRQPYTNIIQNQLWILTPALNEDQIHNFGDISEFRELEKARGI